MSQNDLNESAPLLSTNSTNSNEVGEVGKRLPQYVAALSASLSALAAGSIIGWSSPAGPRITDGREYGFVITESENAWIGSLICLGAALMCFPAGHLMDKIGRKNAMLLMVAPFTLGWTLVFFAKNLTALLIGRFVIGMAAGSYCVTAPAYISEIAQDRLRGVLGTFFQLMVTAGVLYAYAVGSYAKVYILNIACGALPILFAFLFYFMPESPHHLVYLKKIDDAKSSLTWLRGAQYDIQQELDAIVENVEQMRTGSTSVRESFGNKAAIRALTICSALMIFQQFTGINAVLFNTTAIFESAGSKISSKISTIIVGAIQVLATFISSLVIEKLGRKLLLLFSSITIILCTILLGVYFHFLKNKDANQGFLESFSWLPLVSLVIYIVAFSIGLGPIPWLVSGELCTVKIKAFVNSSAGMLNWSLAFVIVTSFQALQGEVGKDGVFWIFSFTSLLGAIFIYFRIPETKGKTLDEIQNLLER